MSELPLYLVDAFTSVPLAGNPAAVCLLPSWPSDAWLQRVGNEMNQAETSFLVPEGAGYRLRWFTPATEVALCGHATLAAAHALWSEGVVDTGVPIQFQTQSGILTARPLGNRIELDFPRTPAVASAPPAGLLEALGTTAVSVGRTTFDYLVEVESAAVVRSLKPNFNLLNQVAARGIMVTARSDQPQYDFISRFFAPAVGINEDSVTGSAHCCLADYWQAKLGRDTLNAYQASPRGGELTVVVHGDRVMLQGQAILVSRGQLLVPVT